MAEQHDFLIDQGTTWNRHILLKNDEDLAVDLTGYNDEDLAVDLTGYTARMQLKRFKRDDVPTLSLTTQNGALTITPLTGRIDFALTASQTAALSGSYFYDLEIIAPNGDVARLLQGSVIVSDEVTR